MRNKKAIISLLITVFALNVCFSCKDPIDTPSEKKIFTSSFENVSDFNGFYITEQNYLNTSFHQLTDSIVHSGSFSHFAWVSGANPASLTSNNNHRAYPTVQLYKTSKGAFTTPCYISFWVWLDMELNANPSGEENDWVSLATFTNDRSDNWARTILVNVNHDGYLHLMHVPNQGEQNHIFQTSIIKFPQKEWVQIRVFLDFRNKAYAKVWQNGELVSHAAINGVSNELAQAHFGLYCAPQIQSGAVFNDDLIIQMVDKE